MAVVTVCRDGAVRVLRAGPAVIAVAIFCICACVVAWWHCRRQWRLWRQRGRRWLGGRSIWRGWWWWERAWWRGEPTAVEVETCIDWRLIEWRRPSQVCMAAEVREVDAMGKEEQVAESGPVPNGEALGVDLDDEADWLRRVIRWDQDPLAPYVTSVSGVDQKRAQGWPRGDVHQDDAVIAAWGGRRRASSAPVPGEMRDGVLRCTKHAAIEKLTRRRRR